MQRYDSYKDSGIQWLGEIPSHWEVVPLKYYSNIIMGQSPNGDDLTDNGQLLFMQGNAEFGNRYPHPTSYCDKCSKKSRVGDILMSVRAPVGALNISDRVYGIGRGLCSIRAINVERDFLWYYLIVARNGFKLVSTGSTYDSVSMDTLCGIKLVVPSLPEQQAIASYLDTATAKIDEAIAQQQKMIDLLNERKQIIINNAVTKGLNPNAKMKPSGIDWIGNIPEHWEVNRLKALTTNMRNGYVGPTRNLYQDAGVPYIQSLHVKNGTIDFNKKEYYVSPQWANKHPKIYKDDLVIVQTGDIGNTAIITEEFNGCNCHALIIVKVNKEIVIPEYLCFYLRSKVGKELMLQTKTGALLPHLNTTEIGTTIVIVPTIEEQWDIVNYLKEEIQKVESLIKIFEKQITLLQERKQIIINDVVTGKVKTTLL